MFFANKIHSTAFLAPPGYSHFCRQNVTDKYKFLGSVNSAISFPNSHFKIKYYHIVVFLVGLGLKVRLLADRIYFSSALTGASRGMRNPIFVRTTSSIHSRRCVWDISVITNKCTSVLIFILSLLKAASGFECSMRIPVCGKRWTCFTCNTETNVIRKN